MISGGWGTWIRTMTSGVRVGSPGLIPLSFLSKDAENRPFRIKGIRAFFKRLCLLRICACA
jgi:hypothetical protein